MADIANEGGADEDGVKRRVEAIDGQVCLEAVDLAAEGVADDLYVDESQSLAVEVSGFAGHDYEAGAGAPDRLLGREIADRLKEAVHGHETGDGGALTAGDYEAIDFCQVSWEAHLARVRIEAFEDGLVLRKIAL
jgi:hypothetical protein